MAQPTNVPKVLNLSFGTNVGSKATDERNFRLTVGFSSADILVDSQATYQILAIPAQTFICSIAVRVIVAFTTSVTITLGDTNSASGWMASAKIAPQSADAVGIYKHPLVGAQDTYAGGRKYLTADNMVCVIGGATVAAGLLEVQIQYVDGLSGNT